MPRLVLIVVGAALGALAAFVFDFGAKPCLDVRSGTAACAVTQPATWAVLFCAAVGAVALLGVTHLAGRRRR